MPMSGAQPLGVPGRGEVAGDRHEGAELRVGDVGPARPGATDAGEVGEALKPGCVEASLPVMNLPPGTQAVPGGAPPPPGFASP
jgi:hypothetical protein